MSARKLARRTLTLPPKERVELQRVCERDPRPSLRECVGAPLKIGQGRTPYGVARHSLLKSRHPETLYGWLNAYPQDRQLPPRPACRRAFSPSRQRASAGAQPHPSAACAGGGSA